MLPRLLSALIAAFLMVGSLPTGVLAADLPAAIAGSGSVVEDTPGPITLTATSDDLGDVTAFTIEPGTVTHGAVGDPSAPVCAAGTCSVQVTFSPATDYFGSASLEFTATGPGGTSGPASIAITVGAVNDPPTFAPGASSIDVAEDSGAYSKTWATAIDPGPGEGLQSVNFQVDTAVPDLFDALPAIAADGTLVFTPRADWSGSSSVTVRAHDNGGTGDYGAADTSAPVTFAINITAVNDAPAPAATSASMPWGFTWLITISASDIEGDATTAFAVATQPAHGDVVIEGPITCDGGHPNVCTAAALYTPDAAYTGPDSFAYTATDATTVSSPATVSITVGANAAPVCADTSTSVAEDGSTNGMLACTDAENETLTYALAGAAAHGTANVGTNGAWTYSPAGNYSGPDSFTFAATDANGASNPATMTITVTPVNDKPVCTGTSLTTDKNVAVSGSVSCHDVDPDTLTLRIGAGPGKGTVSPFNTATGAFTYAPNLDEFGTDSFTVIASDGTVDSDAVTVEIGIANHAPVCSNASPGAGNEDTIQIGTLACTDDDSDPLAYSVDGPPAHGDLSLDAGTGAWTYTPAPDWSGLDSFTARASDGIATSNTATVSLLVTAVNDAPVANAQSISVAEDSALDPILITATDVEGSAMTYSIVMQPVHGTLDGTTPDLKYTPTLNYNGPDSFTFKANDGQADSNIATVSITVTDVPDKPDAKTDASGLAGFPYVAATTTTTLNVLANDIAGPRIGSTPSEPNDPIVITSVTSPTLGTVSIAPGGTALIYDPRGCATGTDLFTYTVTDGQGLTDTANVVLTVARPGAGGLGNSPITDTPSVGLRSGATIGSTVPVRISWCGVTKSGARLKAYRVGQSPNAGSTWPTVVTSATRGTSVNRSIGTAATYAFRVRMTDNANRAGAYRTSATAKAAIQQESSASIVYAGSWGTRVLAKASGGRVRYSSSPSASATFTVTNTRQVGIVAPKARGYGRVNVWVDGVPAGSFSENASSTQYRRLVFVRSLNPGTPHTITLRPASSRRVYLDAIVTLQ